MSSPDLSGWLLTYLLHSTLLLSAAWLITPRLRSHRVREALWKTALFGGFLTATGQSLFPVSPLAGRMTVRSAAIAAPASVAAPSSDTPQELTKEKGASPVTTAPSWFAGVTLQGVLVAAWGIGAALLLGLYLVRRARFARRIGSRRNVSDPPLAPMLDELRAAAGFGRKVKLTASPALPSPVALGGSEIAVPEAALTDLDPGQQRSMLAHELAHLDRRDPAWLTAACIVEQIAFVQPLNRLARRRIQESAEYLCDEWAVRRTGSGVLLAKCLAKVAEWMEASPRTVPVSGMAEERSHLVARVRRLLEGAPFPAAPGRRTLVTASIAVIAMTLLALPAVSLTRLPAQTPPKVSAEHEDAHEIEGRNRAAVPADTGRIVQALIGALKDPDVEVRRAAVRSISNFEDRSAAPALRESLRDSDAEVRSGAVQALGDMHDAASADAIAALLKDPNREVRANAIEALADLELSAPPSALIDALRDADAEVRHQAAHAIGHFQDARAVPALQGLIDDPNAEVREAAVEALGEIRNEAAIQALIVALKAKDPKVRQAAADALGKR